MHYRNGREAKNGDEVLMLGGYGTGGVQIAAVGVLIRAVAGNDHCNGQIVSTIGAGASGACLCDCLHMEDVVAAFKEKGWDKRPAGK